jgi:hypothetical protein
MLLIPSTSSINTCIHSSPDGKHGTQQPLHFFFGKQIPKNTKSSHGVILLLSQSGEGYQPIFTSPISSLFYIFPFLL